MKDSKVNNNRKPLSDEEVKKAENFDAVLSNVNAKQTSFTQKNWPYMASILVLALIGYFTIGKPENLNTSKEIDEKFKLIAPIKGLDIPNTKFKVIAGEKGQIVTNTGTIISYPANAFIDSVGKQIAGEMEIQFREFHDVVEIFASGIPMQYDSASNKYHFESAGMFDIKGFQNGIPISINPDAPLVIELASKQHGDYFNLYRLDDNGKWHFIEKDTAKGVYETLPDSSTLANFPNKIIELEKRALKSKKGIKKADKTLSKLLNGNNIYTPVKANNDLYSIKLESNKKEFPELAPFKDILFEITEENNGFNPELAKKDWDEIKLKRKINGDYQLTMFDNLKKYKFIVRPVISSTDMSNATSIFDNIFSDYDEKLGGKLSDEKFIRDSLKVIYKSISDSINILNNFASAQAYQMSEVGKSTAMVKRVFTIDDFGIFNSDCPQKLPKGALFEPIFVNQKDSEDTLSFDHIYMAELNKNALYSLYGYWGKPKDTSKISDTKYLSQEISFNPYHKTVIWGVTTDNRIAVIKPNKMGALKTGGNIDVEMFVMEEKLISLDNLRKLLGFS